MSNQKTAFITGASRGIGRGIAIELAKNGFNIVGNATSFDPENKEKGLAEVMSKVEALGAQFEPAPGDIADIDCHEELLSIAMNRFGRVDVLVNNAGVAPRERLDILETTPQIYDHVFAVNTRAAFFLSQCFAKRMIEHSDPEHRQCIIFITSISAYLSTPARSEYCMSKAATSMCSNVLAYRLAEYGVNVYEIRPGITKTDMTAPVADKYDAMINEGVVPQKRWAYPEDVGKAAASLARGDLSFSTGQVLDISGGLLIHHL